MTSSMNPRGLCAVDDCGGDQYRREFCNKHYRRWMKHGTTDTAIPTRGSDNHQWVGDNVSYRALHTRLKAARGPAKNHQCVDCDQTASHWTYDNSDPDEKFSKIGTAYSTDLSRYQPRCIEHHRRLDFAKLKPEDVEQIRFLYASGTLLQREIGDLYGLDDSTVSRIVNRKRWANV